MRDLENINYLHQWIAGVAEAIEARDLDRLEELRRLSDGWLSAEEERQANASLIESVMEVVDSLDY